MAGSLKWFNYVLDDGTSCGILADESNVEAVNGAAANAPTAATAPTRTAPKGTRLRFIQYTSTTGQRSIKVPVLTPTIYAAIPASNRTITDPLTAGQTLTFARKRAEVVRVPVFGVDTGLNDGDNP